MLKRCEFCKKLFNSKKTNQRFCCIRCARLKDNLKHGMYGTRLYEIWRGIKKRCYLKTHIHYKNYGGRGIIMCDEWKNDFKIFYDWSKNNGYKDKLTIDRINNNGNYCPENCRWITIKEQGLNKRTNVFLIYNGEKHTISEWSKIIKINAQTICERRKRGWSDEKIIETKILKKHKR